MSSTINASNGTVSGLISTGDASGELQLQVNNGTPAVTLNTSGAIGVGSSPSYGTSGQVLTSSGSGSAPTWSTVEALPSQTGENGKYLTTNGTTASWATLTVSGGGGATASGNTVLTSSSSGAQAITTTAYGQTVTLPDATTMTKAANIFNIYNAGEFPLKVLNNSGTILGFIYPNKAIMVGLADNSTAAGVWTLPGIEPVAITAQNNFSASSIVFDAQNVIQKIALDADRMFLLINGAASGYTWGIVYNSSTQTWGSITTIRAQNTTARGVLVDTDKLVVTTSSGSTDLQAVVVSISGTTISVGTASTATLGSTFSSFNDLIEVNGGAVISLSRTTAGVQLFAVSVSGTTASIGSATGTSSNFLDCAYLYKITSTTFISFSAQSTSSIQCIVFTVSGNTLTNNSSTTLPLSTGLTARFRVVPVGTRWAVIYINDSNYLNGAIINVSGTTVSASTATITTTTPSDPTNTCDVIVSGSKVIVGWYYTGNFAFNILTDTNSTASVGTVLTVGAGNINSIAAINTSGNYAIFVGYPSGKITKFVIGFSGSSPTLYSTNSLSFNNQTENIYYFTTSNSFGLYKNLRRGTWLKATTSYNIYNPIKSIAVSLNQYNTPALQVPYLSGIYVPGANNESWVYGQSGNAYTSNYLIRIECAA